MSGKCIEGRHRDGWVEVHDRYNELDDSVVSALEMYFEHGFDGGSFANALLEQNYEKAFANAHELLTRDSVVKHMEYANILLMKHKRKEQDFILDVDGFTYWEPHKKGHFTAKELRDTADELDKRNKEIEDSLPKQQWDKCRHGIECRYVCADCNMAATGSCKHDMPYRYACEECDEEYLCKNCDGETGCEECT